MTMLTEYEWMTRPGLRGLPVLPPVPRRLEEDEEPVRLEERKDAPTLLQL